MRFDRYGYVNSNLTKTYILQNIQSRGIYTDQQEHNDYMDEQSRFGLHLLNIEFPKIFKSCSIPLNGLFIDFASEYPLLYERLRGTAAFGYTQGRLIHELQGGNDDLKEKVAQISAIFNVGISLFDFVVDESPTGIEFYKTINQEFLKDLMDLTKEISLKNIHYKEDTADIIERLLILFIFAFGMKCRHIYQLSRNKDAWDRLSDSIFRLYYAEKTTCALQFNKIVSSDQWLDALKCKSVLPSRTHSLISEITMASDFEQGKNNVEDICCTIGHIFWLADDLSDIAKDLQAGIPSYITTKAAKFYSQENNLSNKLNLNESLIEAINDLCTFLTKLEKDMKSLLDSHVIQKSTHDELLKFVKMYVNGWLIG